MKLTLSTQQGSLVAKPEAPKSSARLRCESCGEEGLFAFFLHWTPTSLLECPACGSIKATFTVKSGRELNRRISGVG